MVVKRFYNRLLLINACVFIILLYAFAFFASSYAKRVELNEEQKQNFKALVTLCDYYGSKHDEFLNIVFPLYDKKGNYDILSKLLEEPSDSLLLNDPFFRQQVTNMMQWLSVRDKDIAGILLNSTVSGNRYVYSNLNQTFEPASRRFPFFSQLTDKPPGRVMYGTRQIESSTAEQFAYGITGSLSTQNYQQAGHLLVMYDVNALHEIYENDVGKVHGHYMILSEKGDVIFDSSRQFYEKIYPDMDVLLDPGVKKTLNGQKVYIQVISKSNHNYLGVHIVTQAEVEGLSGRNRLLIYGICTGFALLAIVLYVIAGILASRRVTSLQHGMDRIGSHNLQYRIPLRGQKDEFEHIAMSFNRMCDELQANIDRVYVYELKQKRAELGALQARINPHFLYNTLETIRSKVFEDGNEEASDMIVLLSNIFRNVIHKETFITISEEMEFSRMYIELYNLRFAGIISTKFNVDEGIMEFGTVKNILQPIIENYFVHGYSQDREDNIVDIQGCQDGDSIVLKVIDNGRGIAPERLAEVCKRLEVFDPHDSSSYGLANVNERIKLVFGDQYGLTINSQLDKGTCITLRIRRITCEKIREMMERNTVDDNRDIEVGNFSLKKEIKQ
ncbi:MAG: histidine kinase [Spirochaetales bacterium]|nr:histidine kinase [Spirochaetales bacterium]